MGSKDELKEIDVKNRACCYLDDTMRVIDIDFSNVLLNEKSHETNKKFLIYNISYKTFMSSKPLLIRFDEIDEFIISYGGAIYLASFGS